MWRGSSSDPLCTHDCCSGLTACVFSSPAVFETARQRDSYEAARLSFPSSPQGVFFHGTSLLTTWSELEERVLTERRLQLGRLRPEEAAGCREFIFNKRDAPLDCQALSIAVFSQYVSLGSSTDRGMPNLEDYRRCFPGRYFGGARSRAEPGAPGALEWVERRPCAIFRGSATGSGVTPADNPRLKLAVLSQRWETEAPGLLDAKLTSWNLRQKIDEAGHLQLLDPQELRSQHGLEDVGKHHFMQLEEQARYKYAVYLDGNVGAGRLGALLGLGFVLLIPPSRKPQTFLRQFLQAGTHYVPIKEDLEDLKEALLWLREHDAEAEAMSRANLELHRLFCSREAIETCFRDLCAPLEPLLPPTLLREDLWHLWQKKKCFIYVLVDEAFNVLQFCPCFNHADYRNTQPFRPSPGRSLSSFLRKVRAITGERISLPVERWWSNGSLVCNAPVADSWGESLIAEMRLLLSSLAHRRSR